MRLKYIGAVPISITGVGGTTRPGDVVDVPEHIVGRLRSGEFEAVDGAAPPPPPPKAKQAAKAKPKGMTTETAWAQQADKIGQPKQGTLTPEEET